VALAFRPARSFATNVERNKKNSAVQTAKLRSRLVLSFAMNVAKKCSPAQQFVSALKIACWVLDSAGDQFPHVERGT